MFLNKYVDDFYYNLIIENYDFDYLNSLDEVNFVNIYNIFKNFDFYFIDDIILNYLDIFEMEKDYVLNSLLRLKEKLGKNFVYKIGHNMSLLNEIY